MSEKRFTIKPQDDYWAVVDNYNDDKVCIINGIHTEIEAIWLCDFMNNQQATISHLEKVNGKNFAKRKLLEQDNLVLQNENEQLRKQHQRLYNYFRDYLEDEMSAANFGEMWDTVKVDERWNDE